MAFSVHHKVKVVDLGLATKILQIHYSKDAQLTEPVAWSEEQVIDAINANVINSLCYAEMSDHSDAVSVIALSRDASCLASASLDGKICIYSLVSRNLSGVRNTLRPIHVLRPHDGLPLYALIFLDSVLRGDDGSPTWSHFVTGAQSNREIRLWSCYDWSCLQVVRFCSGVLNTDSVKQTNMPISKSGITLAVDQTASFLIATDVTRRVLYTLEIGSTVNALKDLFERDNAIILSSSPASQSREVCFISIGEFLLTTPCLLFALGPFSRKAKVDVGSPLKGRNGLQKVLMDQICLDIHIIHNRNLLNGTIRFEVPHRSDSVMSDLITSILQSSSSAKSPVHHQQTVDDGNVDGANSNNNDDNASKIDSSLNTNENELTKLSQMSNLFDEDTVACQQLDHDSLVLDISENDPIKCEKANMKDDSECFLSTAVIKEHISGAENVSPSLIEPPEAEKLPDVLPITFLDINIQSFKKLHEFPQEFVNEVTMIDANSLTESATPDATVSSSSFASPFCMKPSCADADNDDEYVSLSQPIESVNLNEKSHHHHITIAHEQIESTKLSTDDNSDEVGFQAMDSPDSVDKKAFSVHDLLDSTLQKLLRNSTPRLSKHKNELDSGINPDQLDLNDINILPPESPGSVTPPLLPPLTPLSSPPSITVANEEMSLPVTSQIIIESSLSSLNRDNIGEVEAEADEDDSRDHQLFGCVKSTLKEDNGSEKDKNDDENNNNNNNLHITTDNKVDMILDQLKVLAETSQEQNKQFKSMMEQFNQTKSKLEQLERMQSEISKQLSKSNHQTLPSYIMTKSGSKSPGGGGGDKKSSELANQIILQLRTVQGDFSRRYSQIEESMNKILLGVQESHHAKTTMLFSLESRINLLPKLISDSLKPVLCEELQKMFTNSILHITEPLHQAIYHAMQEGLSNLTSSLTETVQRTLREKNFTSQIVRSASGALTSELSGAYRDSLNKIFVPALEKGIKKLFTDLNELFQTGTQQYLNQISSHVQTPFDSAKFTTALKNQITNVIKSTISATLKETDIRCVTAETVVNTGKVKSVHPGDVHSDHSDSYLSSGVTNSSSNNTNTNQNKASSSSTKKLNSKKLNTNSNTTSTSKIKGQAAGNEIVQEPQPPSSLVKQDELARLIGQAQVLIRSNRLVAALELALVSTNQPLLLDVCNDIDVNQLFGSGDHKIGQNVLLSLIHQLSCGDLNVQLDLKIRYLQEAVLCLEPDDPTTSVHGPAILNLLNARLEALLNSPNSSMKANSKVANSLRSRVVKLNRSAKCLFQQASSTEK
ncbi:unnamed protein product [Heterobilharzia americana]|nr:unnamed protein product [Heterobilharzia americana]